MSTIQVNLALLEEFEQNLDPQHPECSRIPARVLGYGEISTVFEIQAEGLQGLAFKRLPLFHSEGRLSPGSVSCGKPVLQVPATLSQ
jgi:hypothetical protein